MRLLAVDPGSNQIGFAYFSAADKLVETAIMRLPRGPEESPTSWLERVTFAAARISDRSILWAPQVVAIEDVTLARGPKLNPYTLATMAQTRGYLVRVFQQEYPGVEFLDVHPASEKKALGLPAFKVDRKMRQAAARARFPGKTQEEADAAVIGIAAYALIGEARKVAGLAALD